MTLFIQYSYIFVALVKIANNAHVVGRNEYVVSGAWLQKHVARTTAHSGIVNFQGVTPSCT